MRKRMLLFKPEATPFLKNRICIHPVHLFIYHPSIFLFFPPVPKPVMQKEEDSKPLGICHRLYNLLLSRLVSFLRTASGHPLPQVPTEVPVELKNGGHKKGDGSTVTSNEAQLQEVSETVPVKDHGNELPSVRDIAISNGKTSADQLQDKGPPMVKPILTEEGKASGTAGKVTVSIEEGKMKERPLPSVTLVTNINKISDNFIRQRKKAMQRTDSIEPKKF